MIFSRKQKLNVLEAVAKQHGVSVAEVRREMELSIAEAKNNPDPEKQAEFKRLFGDKTPTPEEFIMKISREASKGKGGMNGFKI
ncbi:hypothetical protein [Hespellia stercorisuis]|uniref:Sporulation initiation factor Spo0A C terminal n=1 Tax=Hespellia stercorisuis DSM 15480 TaxID=1121950 RepID=A0A1M6VB58_9FIRM|nr:hypothetical protein [Hespellia stercorisuis]SHK78594.1 hypothetical protein SAMN02745243_03729 [Hespellia stercorisuis DSM 15480]